MFVIDHHAGYILSAYGIAALVLIGLAVWIVADGRAQRRLLADLEAKGMTRRSARQGTDANGD